jgi:hypothetical protein
LSWNAGSRYIRPARRTAAAGRSGTRTASGNRARRQAQDGVTDPGEIGTFAALVRPKRMQEEVKLPGRVRELPNARYTIPNIGAAEIDRRKFNA